MVVKAGEIKTDAKDISSTRKNWMFQKSVLILKYVQTALKIMLLAVVETFELKR